VFVDTAGCQLYIALLAADSLHLGTECKIRAPEDALSLARSDRTRLHLTGSARRSKSQGCWSVARVSIVVGVGLERRRPSTEAERPNTDQCPTIAMAIVLEVEEYAAKWTRAEWMDYRRLSDLQIIVLGSIIASLFMTAGDGCGRAADGESLVPGQRPSQPQSPLRIDRRSSTVPSNAHSRLRGLMDPW
jgi:hypothetical protein